MMLCHVMSVNNFWKFRQNSTINQNVAPVCTKNVMNGKINDKRPIVLTFSRQF